MLIAETERLAVRPFEPGDCDFIIRLLNDPSFIENIADKGVRTREQAAAYLADGPLRSYRDHGHGLYLVALKASGAPIGMCGLLRRDSLAHPDLGYAFLPEFCGRGYAFEAGAAVLAYGREVLGMGEILAIVKPGNARSAALLDRLGFARAGTVAMAHDPEPLDLFVSRPAAAAAG